VDDVLPDGLATLLASASATGATCQACAIATPTVPKLALSMTSPPVLPLGGSSTYTLTVSNRGGSATTGSVAFSDLLPEGLAFTGQLSGAPAFTCAASGSAVACAGVPDIPAGGEAAVELGVAVSARASGLLTSTATLTQLGGDPRQPACDATVPAQGQASQSTDGTCALATGSALSGDAVEFRGSGCGCVQGRAAGGPGLGGLALAVAVLLGPALRRRRRG